MNKYQKAKIHVFHLRHDKGVVYIHGTIQNTVSRCISSLNDRRVNYLNRLQLNEKCRSPRLDDLAKIFAGEEYEYYTLDYPCISKNELYRECERMYGRLSAEQILRNRASKREYYARNKEKESKRYADYMEKNRDKVNAKKRHTYHHGTRCKDYKPTKNKIEGIPSFGIKSGACMVTFD